MPFPGLNRAQVQTLIDASMGTYYTISEIDTLLSGKSSTGHTHDDRYYTETEIDALLSGLGGDHNHDDLYYTQAEVDTLLLGKASTSHTHDDRYFTESEVNTLLSGKSDTGHTHDYSSVYAALVHNHDDRYYTDSEVDAAFAALSGVYAPSSHNHSASAITSGTLDVARLPDLSAVYSVVGHNHDLVYAALSHHHNDLYYGKSAVDIALAGKSNTGHLHDDRYALLDHNHTGTYQPIDDDLTALAALSSTGFAKRTGSNAWSVDPLVAGDIPNLAASILTSGTLDDARLSTNVVTLTGTQSLSNKTLVSSIISNSLSMPAATFIDANQTTVGTTFIRIRVNAEPDYRFAMLNTGELRWYDGAGVRDMSLFRHSGGSMRLLAQTAQTNTVANMLSLSHTTSGTAAAGFGVGIEMLLKSNGGASHQRGGVVEAFWNDATEASKKADLVFSAYDSAKREGLRIRGNGSAAALGFYGATPVAKPSITGSRSGNAALANLLTQLAALGLITDSTTA